jgi:hypothetical protein
MKTDDGKAPGADDPRAGVCNLGERGPLWRSGGSLDPSGAGVEQCWTPQVQDAAGTTTPDDNIINELGDFA